MDQPWKRVASSRQVRAEVYDMHIHMIELEVGYKFKIYFVAKQCLNRAKPW